MSKPRKLTRQKSRNDVTLQLRLRPEEKAVLVRAAKLCKTSLGKFILAHACQAAQQVLADQVQFVLPDERWQAFCDALDAPPRLVPALRKLLVETSVFEE